MLKAYFNGQLTQSVAYSPDHIGLRQAMDAKTLSPHNRNALTLEWSKQYADQPHRLELIQRLGQHDVYTVTTGHQLGLASGPAYTIYKIASAIALAKKCNALWPDRTVIPVFWMATEDHDFAEINHCHGRAMDCKWDHTHGGPVGRLTNDGLLQALEPWLLWLQENNAASTAEMLDEVYQKQTLAEAFRALIERLFAHEDLLILDADRPAFKKTLIPLMWSELTERRTMPAMQESSKWLDECGFEKQVTPREINLFYQTNDTRKRIMLSGEYWQVVDSTVRWNQHELREELDAFPERFSPNVALRPLYQETLLPNIAYVGGPGEVSYWLQLKPVFDAFDVQMPVVLLRDSALLLNRGAARKWFKLGADVNMFKHSFETIQNSWVEEVAVDLGPRRQALSQIMQQVKIDMAALDPALVTATDMELNKLLQGLDGLEKKMAKVIRQKEEVKIQQLKALFAETMPNGVPQERHLNFLDLQAQMSEDVLPQLVQAFDPFERQLTIVIDADPDKTAVK